MASFQQRPSTNLLEPDKTKEASLALNLVVDALARGHGTLAGRIARKAFILVEKMFTLDGPALAWNLLVIIYETVVARQTLLFEMLLAHVISLARCRMPKTHPLLKILSALQRFALQPDSGICHPGGLSVAPPSSLSTSISHHKETMTVIDPEIPSNSLSALLERSWILNAEILFNQLDTRFFHLYCCIDWDSSSMILPAPMVDAATKWFGRIEAQDRFRMTTATRTKHSVRPFTQVEEDMMHQRLSTVQIGTLSLREYETLWATSIAGLRRDWDAYLHEQADISGDTGILIRALAGLTTANVLEDSFTSFGSSNSVTRDAPQISRLRARHLACVIRASHDLRRVRKSDGSTSPLNSISQMKAIVALCAYAYGETDPRVVQEMRSLQEALIADGDHSEADRIGDDVSHRLEQYIRHIPPNAM